MKNSLVGMLSLAVFASAAETLYPVYTVTTTAEDITTNALESCVVSVVASEGAEPTETTFAALDKSAGNFSGTFVLRPASYLMGSTAMTNFTGVIRIETGAYIAPGPGCLGPMVSTTAPKLYVLDGASLVVSAPKKPNGRVYNELHISGEGYQNIGAVCNRLGEAHGDYWLYNNFHLEGDASFGMDNDSRVDLGGGGYKSFYLNDHVFTVRKSQSKSKASRFYSYDARLIAGGDHACVRVLDGCFFVPQGGVSSWTGSASNEVRVIGSSGFSFFNTIVTIPWTLIWDSSATASFSGNANWGAYFGELTRNYYQGNVRLDSSCMKICGEKGNGLSIRGAVSGVGGLDATTMWLQLLGTNSWTGTTSIHGVEGKPETGLAFHRAWSVPPAVETIALTNARLRLVEQMHTAGTEAWHLPSLEVNVPTGSNDALDVYAKLKNTVFTTGPANYVPHGARVTGTLANLRKTGAGTFAIEDGVFAITGRTEVLAGTLKLGAAAVYSTAPGLWEGSYPATDEDRAAWNALSTSERPPYKAFGTRVCYSNRVTDCVYLGTLQGWPWQNFQMNTYSGYIWNRNATNETWTFVGSIYDAVMIYINGSRPISIYDSQNLGMASATLKPGANAFEVRMWANTYGATSGGGMKPKNTPGWVVGKGFAMMPGTTSLTKEEIVADMFIAPTNGPAACPGGDGFYFTRDPRAAADFSAEELAATRPSISNLVLRKEGTLDLSGSPLFVETLAGFGTVTNGSLTVKGGWTLTDDDLESGGTLSVDGTLIFTSETPFTFDGLDAVDRSISGTEVTLVRAKGGIVGTPRYEPAAGSSKARKWHLSSATLPDGSATLTFTYLAGTSLIFR